MMFKNKMRSFLTMLGIIIGILSLILIVVFGKSFSVTFSSVTESLFKNDQLLINIIPAEDNKNVVYDEYGIAVIPEGISLDIRDVEKQLKTINADSYVKGGGTLSEIGSGENQGRTTKFAIDSSCADEMFLKGYTIINGRDISRADEVYKASVALISDVAANYLFRGEDPIGKSLTLKVRNNITPVNVIGVYQTKGISDEDISEVQTYCFVNRAFVESELAAVIDDSYWERESVSVTMKGVTDKEAFKNELVEAVASGFNNDKWTLEAYSLSEQIGSTNAIIGIIMKIIFVIAAISLLIGGIGIMNVMLITVTERTNEIGVRKALGADNLVIIFQFLCESFVLSLSGTIIGVLLGFLLSKLMGFLAGGMLQNSLGIPISIDISLPFSVIALAVVFSLVIGVVFGIYPALKAVKMQVVDALRYE